MREATEQGVGKLRPLAACGPQGHFVPSRVCELLLVYRLMRRATGLIHIRYTLLKLKFCSICLQFILLFIFVNVKTLVMLMSFLQQARGRPTWSLRATRCPQGTTLVTPALGEEFSTFHGPLPSTDTFNDRVLPDYRLRSLETGFLNRGHKYRPLPITVALP